MALFFSFPDVVDETPAHFLGVPHGHKHPARALNTDERSDRERAALHTTGAREEEEEEERDACALNVTEAKEGIHAWRV